MAEILFEGNGIISIRSVESEEDLKLRPGININPPPQDGRCMCCNRHISELKPFGKAGDPLVGDFDGAFLVKTFRADDPYVEEATRAMAKAERCCRDDESKNPLDWLIDNYGEERGQDLFDMAKEDLHVSKSWECRDCIVLDDYEYFCKLENGE
jgi:hypothetical protein